MLDWLIKAETKFVFSCEKFEQEENEAVGFS